MKSFDPIVVARCAQRLLAEAGPVGLRLTDSHATDLCRHVALVYQANATMNLTRIPQDVAISMHVLDSLSGLEWVARGPEGPVADIGSGAGFPGVPLAIVGGRHVDLFESVGKKAAFLEHVVAELGLDATVRGCRAEEAASPRGTYAIVVARAVSALPALVELASPLLARDGRLICWKGDPEPAELERGDLVAGMVGMKRIGVERRGDIPGTTRTLVVYEKEGPGRVALPRRAGMAQRQPLA